LLKHTNCVLHSSKLWIIQRLKQKEKTEIRNSVTYSWQIVVADNLILCEGNIIVLLTFLSHTHMSCVWNDRSCIVVVVHYCSMNLGSIVLGFYHNLIGAGEFW
jgi:hypothetical protein